jgi:hypothetical protein
MIGVGSRAVVAHSTLVGSTFEKGSELAPGGKMAAASTAALGSSKVDSSLRLLDVSVVVLRVQIEASGLFE